MIEIAEPTHLDELLTLTRACGAHLRAQGIDQWDENYPDAESLKADLSSRNLFIHKEDGIITGCVVLNETQDEAYSTVTWKNETPPFLVVHRLAVHPDYQGRGIARKLMDFSEDLAQRSGYKSIRLDTYSQNARNLKFYANRGYDNRGKVWLPYKKEFQYVCFELIF